MLALFNHITSESSRKRIEKMTLFLALFFFIAHLVIIYLIKFNYLNINPGSGLFSNPISAIYTPFSFILVYEVYLLIYYLPKSFTNYLTKQYEIITLIVFFLVPRPAPCLVFFRADVCLLFIVILYN